MSWTSGYIAEIDYTHGYYSDISPSTMDFALLLRGYAPPQRGPDMKYCELGYGQGLSTNIHAAAMSGDFWGTDMNPAHAANARTLANVTGTPVKFFDENFEEFVKRDDLPEFDYITMHGIWSWVADHTRDAICDIIRKRLKVGGVFFISYNCLPGWAPVMPVRHLLSLYAENAMGDAAGIMARVDGALNFAKQVAQQGRYFQTNPIAAARLDGIGGQDRQYVAHEYFNRHWTPKYFSEVDAMMVESKVTFAGSATILEHVDGINLTGEQQQLLNSLGGGPLREQVRDFMVNQQFRRDLYVRGARRLSQVEQLERLSAMPFVLSVPLKDAPTKLVTGLGEMQLREDIYKPIAEALAAEDGRPKSIVDLEKMDLCKDLGRTALLEALTVMTGIGAVCPAQTEAEVAANAARAQALSAHIISQSRMSGQLNNLPSPVTGTGIPVGRFEQLFLLERSKGVTDPVKWAEAAWATLSSQGQRILKAGAVLETPEENLAELTEQAKTLAEHRLPMLIRLGVVPAQVVGAKKAA